MNDKQLEKLKKLQTLLFDTVMIDCNPKNWNGYDKKPVDLSRDERGSRSFDLKNADKTMAIFARTVNIINTHTKSTLGNVKSDEEIDLDLKAIEQEAAKLLAEADIKGDNVH